MTQRRPLVLVNGVKSELPVSDTVAGINAGSLTAGSGLSGGGTLDGSAVRVDVSLAAAASGLIFVGDDLGIDGAAQVIANEALASGNSALLDSSNALASGNAALVNAGIALASGNAALIDSASALASGNAALSDLTAKYDKSGGLISGAVTVDAQVVGSPNYIIASGVILLNFGASNNFEIVLTSGTQTLASPVNPSGGQTGTIVVRQDDTGSRLLVYSGGWQFPNGTAPTLTTTASGVDVISYYCVNPNRINAAVTLNYGSGTVA